MHSLHQIFHTRPPLSHIHSHPQAHALSHTHTQIFFGFKNGYSSPMQQQTSTKVESSHRRAVEKESKWATHSLNKWLTAACTLVSEWERDREGGRGEGSGGGKGSHICGRCELTGVAGDQFTGELGWKKISKIGAFCKILIFLSEAFLRWSDPKDCQRKSRR